MLLVILSLAQMTYITEPSILETTLISTEFENKETICRNHIILYSELCL
jgi:hypothetical protein